MLKTCGHERMLDCGINVIVDREKLHLPSCTCLSSCC
jgi:hypothetical protein